MPALEAWENVIITGSNCDAFLNSVHGQMSCQTCHGGAADYTFNTKDEAHEGMIHDPSAFDAAGGERPNPFAALAALKKRS